MTKVNQEWTSMRKNLLRILINKINVFNKKTIVSNEYEQSEKVRDHAKPATYDYLWERKQCFLIFVHIVHT